MRAHRGGRVTPAPATAYSVETCLEPEAVRALLQQALAVGAGRGVTIDRLRVLSARRSASRHRNPNPLTLRYEAEVHDGATGMPDTLRYYAKVYRDGASAAAAHQTAALHLPQLDMLVWPWPADPALPQLPQLLDPAQTQRWWGAPAHAVHALRYEPEQRATLRYLRNAQGGATAQLYAKTFSDERGAALQRRFAHFWERAQHDEHAPGVAQPLGYCADTRTFWQAQAAGVPLPSALKAESAIALALPTPLAHALAAIHAAPHELAGAPPHDIAHWLGEVRRRRTKIARAAPHLAWRVARVAEAIEQAAVLLPPAPHALIHGDFHAGQVSLDGEHIVLFDFDEFTLGDPMEDLAAFVARHASTPADAAFAEAFVAAYQRVAPARFCSYRLHWHGVIQLLLQVSRAFVFQVQDWRLEIERRLARAEALCASTTMRFSS
jgi:hypothetical protein